MKGEKVSTHSGALRGDVRLWRRLWPEGLNSASHGERWLSAIGGFVGIFALLWISGSVLDQQGATMLVASMGASSVLLFAVPHGALSQPWPLVGGNIVSAFIGVSCARYIDDPYLAAALAVGLAIGVMYYLRCLHPPGGATALVAVLGGESVHQLGYSFVLTPVAENVLVLLAVALLFSLPFSRRRYPAVAVAEQGKTEKAMIAHSDLVYALSQLDSFVDVSEQDLIRIYTLAVHHSHEPVRCHLQGEECDEGEGDCLCRQLRGVES